MTFRLNSSVVAHMILLISNCGHLTANRESRCSMAIGLSGRLCLLEIDALPFLLLRFTTGSLASRGLAGTNCNEGNYDTVRIKTGKAD